MNRFRLAHHASGSENQPSGFCGHILVRKEPAVIEAVQPRAREQGRGSLRQPLQNPLGSSDTTESQDSSTPKLQHEARAHRTSDCIDLDEILHRQKVCHCVGERSSGYFSGQWLRFAEAGQIDHDYLPLGGQRIEESSPKNANAQPKPLMRNRGGTVPSSDMVQIHRTVLTALLHLWHQRQEGSLAARTSTF